MAEFIQALKITLKAEGGYSYEKSDLGGETYKGVSRVKNPDWVGWHIIDNAKSQPEFPLSLDKNALLSEQLESFYRLHYWNPMMGDQLTSQEMANAIFDFGVNVGVHTSIQIAQHIISSKPDGVVGPVTLSCLNNISPECFLVYFTLAKIKHYFTIVVARPTNRLFLVGWLTRALSFVPKGVLN